MHRLHGARSVTKSGPSGSVVPGYPRRHSDKK